MSAPFRPCILALLLACQTENEVKPRLSEAPDEEAADTSPPSPNTGADTGDDEAEDLPSDYVFDEEEPPPLLSLDEVALSLEEAAAAFRAWRPFLAFDAHGAMLSQGDSACPTPYDDYYTNYGYYYYYGGCTATTGLTYAGYIYGITYSDSLDSVYYDYDNYGWWYGDGVAVLPDGQQYTMAGYFYGYEYTYLPSPTSYVYLSYTGGAHWSGDTFGDTWLGDDVSLAITVSGAAAPGAGAYLSLEGGLDGYGGTHADSVRFEGVYMATSAWGSDCPQEPSGTLAIRDEANEWYTVAFDGPSYASGETFPAACDGCGEVWYRGTSLGLVCPDLSTLTAWERSPW